MLDLKPDEYRAYPRNFYMAESLRGLTRMRASPIHKHSDSLVQITNVTDRTFPEFKPLFGKSGFTPTVLYILEEYGYAEKTA